MVSSKNKPCPACRERGEDSTGDHFYRAMKGDKPLNFYVCRKCGYKEYVDGTPVRITEETPEVSYVGKLTEADISKLPAVADRGIPKAMRERYGVTTECSEITGAPVKHYYPVTIGGKVVTYKYRDIEKKLAGEKNAFGKTTKGVTGDIELFGMLGMRGTPRIIVITEGEEDAMAAQVMLEPTMHNVHCMSVPDGSSAAHTAIAKNMKLLNRADKVYYVPDQDEPGQKAIEEIVKVFPEILIVQDLPEKDPNEMLKKKLVKEFQACVLRAKKYVPKFLVEVTDSLIELACKPPVWGRLYPWPTLNKWTYGMRDGEGIYIGAGVKIGKTECLNELIKSRLDASDGDIPAIAKFEEQPTKTLIRMAGKMDKCCYHKPDIPFSLADLEKSLRSFKGRMYLYKAFGTANWDILKMWIHYAVSEGAKTVIIDPLTKLTNHLSPSDTEVELRRISDELACMAHDLGFFYVVTCHLKAPPAGKTPHELGGDVLSNQFRGSRAMMENCYYMLGIRRNKDPKLTPLERNTSHFVLLDDRNHGNAGEFMVVYDPETADYLEPPSPTLHF